VGVGVSTIKCESATRAKKNSAPVGRTVVRGVQHDHWGAHPDTSAVVPIVGYCDGGSGIERLG
jgi:hypothetical protein